MSAAQKHFFGKSARLAIEAAVYDGKGWTVTPAAEDMRTDNTADNGYSDRIAGTRDCPFTFEMDWDAAANPMDDPPNLEPGVVLDTVKLHLDEEAAGPFWSFPKALVLNTPHTNMVDAISHFTINAANKGQFYRPSGNFVPSAIASMDSGS